MCQHTANTTAQWLCTLRAFRGKRFLFLVLLGVSRRRRRERAPFHPCIAHSGLVVTRSSFEIATPITWKKEVGKTSISTGAVPSHRVQGLVEAEVSHGSKPSQHGRLRLCRFKRTTIPSHSRCIGN